METKFSNISPGQRFYDTQRGVRWLRTENTIVGNAVNMITGEHYRFYEDDIVII